MLAVCAAGEAIALVKGLLHVASRVPDHFREDATGLLAEVALLCLTATRKVRRPPNEDFGGMCPMSLPSSRTREWLLALAALRRRTTASRHLR